jgi:large subunit ribosomal protein L22
VAQAAAADRVAGGEGVVANAKVSESGVRARAIQRSTRQSPYKMRRVIDLIRGKGVNDALAVLKFAKQHAARQIEKTLASAVANAEDHARRTNAPVDVDELYVQHAIVNEGQKLKRFMPAAMGRATPIRKRTSHIEIVVAERPARPVAAAPKKKATAASDEPKVKKQPAKARSKRAE